MKNNLGNLAKATVLGAVLTCNSSAKSNDSMEAYLRLNGYQQKVSSQVSSVLNEGKQDDLNALLTMNTKGTTRTNLNGGNFVKSGFKSNDSYVVQGQGETLYSIIIKMKDDIKAQHKDNAELSKNLENLPRYISNLAINNKELNNLKAGDKITLSLGDSSSVELSIDFVDGSKFIEPINLVNKK